MNRRTMLQAGAGALSIAALPVPLGAAPFRRARPGDPGWPSSEAWAGLNQAVGGRLTKPEPLLASCASGGDAAACADVLEHLNNPLFIGDQPSGTQVSGWFNAWRPEASAYVVRARSAEDVAAAVRFARQHRLRLAVKGGGHSYQGDIDGRGFTPDLDAVDERGRSA